MSYADMTKTLLETQNPQELQRLKAVGILDEVLKETEAVYGQQEADIVREMTQDLPADLPYQERVQAMNRAQSVAREITSADLTEFWQSVR